MSAIPAHQLTATDLELWRGDRCLFNGLNLSVASGELLQVTGANGSGKTSLLRVLTGLSLPESGQVAWNDRPIGRDRATFQAAMGYVAHRDGHYDDLTLAQNLGWGAGLHADVDRDAVACVLRELGLEHVAEVPGYALSAGQKRRLSLARLSMSQKQLWIMDEPLANLDVDARAWCNALIGAHIQRGGSVIATSHQPLCEGAATRTEVQLAA